jgi:hypothetical protein
VGSEPGSTYPAGGRPGSGSIRTPLKCSEIWAIVVRRKVLPGPYWGRWHPWIPSNPSEIGSHSSALGSHRAFATSRHPARIPVLCAGVPLDLRPPGRPHGHALRRRESDAAMISGHRSLRLPHLVLLAGLAVCALSSTCSSSVEARVRSPIEMGDPTVGDEKPAQGPSKSPTLKFTPTYSSTEARVTLRGEGALFSWIRLILASRGLVVAVLWLP